MAWFPRVAVDIGGMLVISVLSGAGVLQYANVRSSYTVDMTGRAMAVFTMAMFLGVALVQSLSGWAAALAQQAGLDPFAGVACSIAAMLVLGASAFALLPAQRAH